MERLDSFVPTKLLQRIRRANGDATGAACAPFGGAALFADISGYTQLAGKLCERGLDGTEELALILEQAFNTYVQTVTDTDGEVACFAGDALVAYWAAQGGDLAAARSQAQDCARRLHDASGQSTLVVDSKPVPVPPPLRIGIGAGQLWGAHLGTDDAWQVLLAGKAVEDAGAEKSRATPGETKCAPIDTDPWGGDPAGTIARGTDSSLRDDGSPNLEGHVAKAVQEYAAGGRVAWLEQLRPVCALFVKVNGLRETASNALSRHQEAVTAIHLALIPYTESRGTLLLDDNGLVFTVCVGMPCDLSDAPVALRAVRAGQAIQSHLARLGLSCSVGVDAGNGACMAIGGPSRQEYRAVGSFMNHAARLMLSTRDGFLCTEHVESVKSVRSAVGLDPVLPLELKGVRLPVRAFHVREATVLGNPVLCGRHDEKKRFQRLVDDLQHGSGGILWIAGTAGVGKTALVRYLEDVVTRRDIAFLLGGAGRFTPDGREGTDAPASMREAVAVPYAPWRPVFTRLLGTPGALSLDERQSRLDGIDPSALAPLINDVIPGFVNETETTQGMSAQPRADAALSVLSQVIGQQGMDRFVLVLEDCHWMEDFSSWRLLLRVVQDNPHSLIVLTSREEDWPSGVARRVSREGTVVSGGGRDQGEDGPRRLRSFNDVLPKDTTLRTMTLPTLAPEAIGQLVTSLLRHHGVHPPIVKRIVAKSNGNPLLAREYALLLSTGQTPADQDESDAPVGIDARRVPEQIRNTISKRLIELGTDESVVLMAASVIGSRFDRDLLEGVGRNLAERQADDSDTHALGDLPRGEELEPILLKLVERELIVRIDPGGWRFAFRHEAIRDATYDRLFHRDEASYDQVLYSEISRRRRRVIHECVAKSLEQRYADDETELSRAIATLAHHWRSAEVPKRAIRYTDKAASQALESGAFEEARRLVMICIALAADVDVARTQQIRWWRQCADACEGTGALGERGDAATKVLSLAGVDQPTGLRLKVSAVARFCRAFGLPKARSPRDDDNETELHIAQAFRHRAEICYFENQLWKMIHGNVCAVDRAGGADPSPALAATAAMAQAELGGVVSIGISRWLGERILKSAMAQASGVADRTALAHAHMCNALYFVGRGGDAWDEAEVSINTCQNLCQGRLDPATEAEVNRVTEDLKDPVTWANVQAVRFWMNYYAGEFGEARAAAVDLHDRAIEAGNSQHQAWSYRYLALCALRPGSDECESAGQTFSALRRANAPQAVDHMESVLKYVEREGATNEQIPARGILALASHLLAEHLREQHRDQDADKARAKARTAARQALSDLKTSGKPIGHSALEGFSALAEYLLALFADARTAECRADVTLCMKVLVEYRRRFPIGGPRYYLHHGDYCRITGATNEARKNYESGAESASSLRMRWDQSQCEQRLAAMTNR